MIEFSNRISIKKHRHSIDIKSTSTYFVNSTTNGDLEKTSLNQIFLYEFHY